jgi:hypothetical protein
MDQHLNRLISTGAGSVLLVFGTFSGDLHPNYFGVGDDHRDIAEQIIILK